MIRPRSRARGFTIVEAAISTVVVAMMLVVALNTLGAASRTRRAHAVQRLGPTIAAELMTEIMQCAYQEDPESDTFGREGTELDTLRADWDDVDDYDGWSASPPQSRDGIEMTDLAGWTREVQVGYADPGDPRVGPSGSRDEGLKRITVTVTSPAGEATVLVALRSSASTYQMEPALTTEYLTWIGVDLRTSDGTSHASGVNLLNPVVIGINPGAAAPE